MRKALLGTAGMAALFACGMPGASAQTMGELCIECLSIRVGPPVVVRGPFPDELDASFTALRLPDGRIRGFSANGATYAVDGVDIYDMGGERRAVLEPGNPGEPEECGRWLTSTVRNGDEVLGFVHQESICNYGPGGQTDKTMAIARSLDDGLTWTDLGTVISGADAPKVGFTTGEGDCSMLDGGDGFLYAYCLRASDWQTIVARAPLGLPTDWRKYFEGSWTEPGLDGHATDIGFVGTGAGYLRDFDLVAAVANDPWFGGVRLSLSRDKLEFADVAEPILPVDGTEWERPAKTELVGYSTIVDPETGSNSVGQRFLLSYIFVPSDKGFEDRYLVHQEVSLTVEPGAPLVQAGIALTRYVDDENRFVTSTGPQTGERAGYRQDAVVAHLLTKAPENIASRKIAECSSDWAGHLDQMLAEDGSCADYSRDRTAGWLFADEQAGSVPVYRCYAEDRQTHFASAAADCEGLGAMEFVLGYGLAP
ncbi:hypothetical protein [Devosia rhizoryzae]|uniref:Exo-alpha-sialidase n=1 Tax=Devosia rhizoryzae TaxID=2774137 RepID=A0ABX7CG66_9HYPH|nr:hypothetical protein [Devosia rhizoryzae]QQR40901.1 hypothetical protein JI748_07950 [Devosia rhizoryzae]